jgi:hypothetical protein
MMSCLEAELLNMRMGEWLISLVIMTISYQPPGYLREFGSFSNLNFSVISHSLTFSRTVTMVGR